MKKILSIILSLLMISSAFTGLGITVNASEISSKTVSSSETDFTYTVNDDGNAVISGYSGTDTDVVIPDTIDGYKVVEIGERAFDNNTSIVSVVIPNSVTSIGNYTFYNCNSLTSIEIPDSVAYIGMKAFAACINLTSIEIPNSLTNISVYAFSACSSLTSIEIPNSVTSIGYGAFEFCSSLTSIEIPDSVTSIGNSAFTRCSSLTSIKIPDSVTSIEDLAFSYCSSLTSIEIPDSITLIDSHVFYSCSSLTSVVIPDSVTSIEDFAFCKCSSLKSIVIPSGTSIGYEAFSTLNSEFIMYGYTNSPAQTYAENNGITFVALDGEEIEKSEFIYEINDYGEAVIQGYNGLDYDIIIPEYIDGYMVSRIAPNAFANNLDIVSVTIPPTVNEIGEGAFECCENLRTVRIDSSALIHTIEYRTFADCRNLQEVVLSDRIESIEDMAFFGCESLEYILIPESTMYIALDAFDCVYPDFAIHGYLGTYAQDYANEKGFRFVSVGGSEYDAVYDYDYYEDGIIINCYYGNDFYLEIPEQIDGQNVVAIGEYAFAYNDAVAEVYLPDTVRSIGMNAFRDCYNLQSVGAIDWNNLNVEIISDYAFSGCSSLYRVEMCENLKEIGCYAFENCYSLESFYVSETVQRIGEYAFVNCQNMKYVDIMGEPDIEDSTFVCTSASFYIRGKRNSSIQKYAMYNQFKFVGLDDEIDYKTGFTYTIDYNSKAIITGYIGADTNIIIPETIGDYYDYEVVAIGDMAFADNNIMTSVVIPDTVTELGRDAFASCDSLVNVKLPNNLSVIPENAFIVCYSLTEFEIPDSVTEIGACAFYMCENLSEINIPEGLRTIGDYALCDCSLSSVTIPKETTIGYAAFNGNYSEFIMYVHYASPAEEFAKQNYIRYRIVGAEDFELSFLPEAGCVYINYYDGSDSDVVIPDEVGDLYMRGIYDGAFRGIQTINSVYIPSKVEFISSNVFYGCTGLTEVVLPESLDWIGVEAFANCTNLKSITVPRETTIGENAFFGVSPEFIMYGYTNSPAQTYAEENNITFVCLDAPEFTYEINDYNEITITGYTGTDTDIVIPDMIDDCMVTTIGERAFFDMDITSVELPETLTEIHMNAFEHCDELTEINIPVRVRYIDSEAFSDCISLREFTVDIDNEYYSSVDGVLYDKKLTTVIRCPMALDREKLDLASTTKTIADRAFEKCFNLYEINLSDSLEKIGSYAFNGCYSLTELTIPGSITEIGESAFTGCGLTTVTLPNGISKIPDNAFDSCSKLESIVIPDSVTAIGELAFINCRELKTIVIPETVTEIGLLAFQGCDSLTSVKLPDGLQALGNGAFYSCDNLTSITIPESITTIGNQLFGLCNSLTSVTLHDGIQSIGWRAFKDCTSLTEIVIPRETTIDDTAFEGANPELVIYGYTNSPAQAYAKENSITFVALDVVKGDMSGDGVVDINDVTDIQKILIGEDELTEEQLYAADVDGDGIVCVRDATYIQKYLAGIVDTL